MKQLLVLKDLTDLFSQRTGFIVAKRDFQFRDMQIDLGFLHRFKDYRDESFYSIPILDFPRFDTDDCEKSERKVFEYCAAQASLRNQEGYVGANRFLVKVRGRNEPVLVEVGSSQEQEGVKGRLSEGCNYWKGDLTKLTRIPGFQKGVLEVQQEFEFAIKSYCW